MEGTDIVQDIRILHSYEHDGLVLAATGPAPLSVEPASEAIA